MPVAVIPLTITLTSFQNARLLAAGAASDLKTTEAQLADLHVKVVSV